MLPLLLNCVCVCFLVVYICKNRSANMLDYDVKGQLQLWLHPWRKKTQTCSHAERADDVVHACCHGNISVPTMISYHLG